MKLQALLAKGLFIVLLLGAYLSLGELQTISKSAATTVLVADSPGTVYAQPAALLSSMQQPWQTVVEVLGQFPNLNQHIQPGLQAGIPAEQHLALAVRQFMRADAYRVTAFGRTDIISPFHHFF